MPEAISEIHRGMVTPHTVCEHPGVVASGPTVAANLPLRDASEERVRFETFISDLSARLMCARPDSIDAEVNRALEEVRRFFDVDRCGLMRVSPDGRFIEISHGAFAPGSEIALDRPIELAELFPWSTESLFRLKQPTSIPRLDLLPPEAARDRESFARLGVRSNLTIPVVVGDEIPHLIVMHSTTRERDWPEPYLSRSRLLGDILVGALERARAEQELRDTLAEVEALRDQLQRENVYLRQEVKSYSGGGIVGQSRPLREALGLVEQVAGTDATVLVLGETGTGKELFAASIHERSRRRDRAMVRVNCAAIPTSLIESELFGREKGAYTGALAKQVGRFEVASGSTIFLDEVGELPAEAQVKLLRVLQAKEIERLGNPQPIKVDVRVIAATNRDLAAAVREGRFREDLYYRLNVFPITVPPLRARPDDIPLLVWAFVDELARSMGKAIDSIPQADLDALSAYSWPGNVRQLRNVVERSMILAAGPKLRVTMPADSPAASRPVTPPARNVESPALAPPPGSAMGLIDVERAHIVSVLTYAGWRVRGRNGAAELLGMKPTTLETRMAKLGIKRPGRG